MNALNEPIHRLVEELKRLPGIGPKSAQRLAYAILKKPAAEVDCLAAAIQSVRSEIKSCSRCNNLTAADPCSICNDPSRDKSIICVVESPFNIFSIEKTGQYRGLYHVLHGTISPLHGMGPEHLKLENLISRLEEGGILEVILATNPNAEGETTALYLANLIKPLGIRASRIAMGLPVGSDLEFADQITMTRSLEGRHEL